MHTEARLFVELCKELFFPFEHFFNARWLDAGSYDVNGSVRDLVDTPVIGLDWRPGPGVDVVSLIKDYRPEAPFDVISCVSTLEHDPWALDDVQRMIGWLKPGGYLLLGCAIEGCKPHRLETAPDGEHYENIDPEKVRGILRPQGTILLELLAYYRGDYNVLFRKAP